MNNTSSALQQAFAALSDQWETLRDDMEPSPSTRWKYFQQTLPPEETVRMDDQWSARKMHIQQQLMLLFEQYLDTCVQQHDDLRMLEQTLYQEHRQREQWDQYIDLAGQTVRVMDRLEHLAQQSVLMFPSPHNAPTPTVSLHASTWPQDPLFQAKETLQHARDLWDDLKHFLGLVVIASPNDEHTMFQRCHDDMQKTPVLLDTPNTPSAWSDIMRLSHRMKQLVSTHIVMVEQRRSHLDSRVQRLSQDMNTALLPHKMVWMRQCPSTLYNLLPSSHQLLHRGSPVSIASSNVVEPTEEPKVTAEYYGMTNMGSARKMRR